MKNAAEAAPYAKPMNTFKLHQFGLASADLLGVYLGRLPLASSKRWVGAAHNVKTVFDSDIQGEANQKVCQNVFEGLEGDLPRTVQATRVEPHFKVSITTEQEEPYCCFLTTWPDILLTKSLRSYWRERERRFTDRS